MAKQKGSNPNRGAKADSGAMLFRRMLVAIDESPAAEAAVGLVAEWVDGPGADVRFVQVIEERKHRRGTAGPVTATAIEPAHRLVVGAPTLGARNRQLVQGLAGAAEEFGADVIVLGFDRGRLAGHRLAPSLREQVMRVTDVPVLVPPSPQADGKRHHRLAQDDGERADTAHRYVRV
jgi:nucleotide-binding universal stress UspA family protein